MDQRFQRLSDLFERGRAADPETRAALLAEAAAEDPALESELRALLEAHEAEPVAGFDEAEPVAAGLGGAVSQAWGQTQDESAPPPHVSGYRVVDRLGSGGMGTVYVAEADNPKRRVALKVLRPEAASDAGRRRFQVEARALARLQHPHIAQILDVGECLTQAGKAPYIAMELVDGVPVHEVARTLSRAESVRLLRDVCDAVAHAHDRGVIHRDLKPANILVTRDGQPKVLDFGLARDIDASTESMQTQTGHVVGTLAYMSPEQARGAREAIDPRTDVYSLGVLAYEVLSGKLPIDVSTVPLLSLIHISEPTRHICLSRMPSSA